MKNYLIIGGMPNVEKDNVSYEPILKPTRSALKRAIISRLFNKSKTKKHINPKIFLKNPDTVIVFDAGVTVNFLNQIKNHYSKQRLIFFYYNPVERSFDVSKIPSGYEIWSYSDYDCKKYNLRKNGQILNDYLLKQCVDVSEQKIKSIYDVVFVGADKGRREELDLFSERMSSIGKKTYIYITKKHAYSPINKRNQKKLSYKDYLIEESKGDVILDLCITKNAGITLRPLEAIVLKKKIITNCDELLKSSLMKYGNIISINESDEEIKKFIETDYTPTPITEINRYLLDDWLKRFN